MVSNKPKNVLSFIFIYIKQQFLFWSIQWFVEIQATAEK